MLLTTVFETAKLKEKDVVWTELLIKTDEELSQLLQEIIAIDSK